VGVWYEQNKNLEMKDLNLIFSGLVMLLVGTSYSQTISFQEHQELGDVHWHRDYDEALAVAKKEDKPVLILFQEVPGCSTCRNYGNNVLTHPHIVEAIEELFIPLTIFNNKGGRDKETLNRYSEPTWNNPVVRVVNSKGKNIVDRLNGNYTSAGLISTINTALTESGVIIPKYLELLEQELTANKDEIFLSMYCFWTGEKEIANLPGVVSTQAGFMNGKEVVKIEYDKNLNSAKKIKKAAAKKSCGDHLYTSNSGYRIDRESKYYLQHSILKHIPMTGLQAAQINRALALPRQITLLSKVKEAKGKGFKNYIEEDFQISWNALGSE